MTAQLRSPQYVIDDVERLLSDLTTPETQVKFDAPSRANPATIQNTISPPAATWHWATNAAQVGQNATLNPEDVGKYGLQDAILTSIGWPALRQTSCGSPYKPFRPPPGPGRT